MRVCTLFLIYCSYGNELNVKKKTETTAGLAVPHNNAWEEVVDWLKPDKDRRQTLHVLVSLSGIVGADKVKKAVPGTSNNPGMSCM